MELSAISSRAVLFLFDAPMTVRGPLGLFHGSSRIGEGRRSPAGVANTTLEVCGKFVPPWNPFPHFLEMNSTLARPRELHWRWIDETWPMATKRLSYRRPVEVEGKC
jgi:hypothetical protein